jgi:hypothetical protein
MKQFGQGSWSGFPAFLPRLRIKIAVFGVACCTSYVRTLKFCITRDLMIRLCSSTLLRRKISKRKKRKKESALTVWKENAMQYFFRKILGLTFSATKLFLKNRLRLDIVGAFS